MSDIIDLDLYRTKRAMRQFAEYMRQPIWPPMMYVPPSLFREYMNVSPSDAAGSASVDLRMVRADDDPGAA